MMQAIAERLIAKKDSILKEPFPFDNTKMFSLWGKTGVGKTHLVEALINHLKEKSPELLKKIFLSRENFTLGNIAGINNYGGLPVVIIDDIFSEFQSIDSLHPATDLRVWMQFIQKMYEERRVIILTSNFPFNSGILEKVKHVDTIGRIVSRMAELFRNAGEVHLIGEDHRHKNLEVPVSALDF